MKRKVVIPMVLLVIPLTFTILSRAYHLEAVSWEKYDGNPLDLGPGNLGTSFSPSVIHDGQVFKMWYLKEFERPRCRVHLADSPDGIHWTEIGMVLDIGAPGSWDERIGNTAVFFDGTTYKMWYQGVDSNGRGRIGYAASSDGVGWTKCGENPVLVPGGNGGWDDFSIGSSTVIFNGTHFMMWYDAQSVRDGTVRIGVATSVDGVSWTKYSGNPVLVPGPAEWDGRHVMSGPVISNGSQYGMWYTGESWWSNIPRPGMRIGLATSPDGFSWSKHDENPVLEPGPLGSWDSHNMICSCVIETDSGLLMWYDGSDGTVLRVGLAMYKCLHATVEIDPDTLNLKSNGQWITAYLTLPEGYNVEDIVLETVYLDGIPAEWSEIQNGTYMAKFDRATVQAAVTKEPDYDSAPKFYDLTLTVTGELIDGTTFQGSDTIRVLSK